MRHVHTMDRCVLHLCFATICCFAALLPPSSAASQCLNDDVRYEPIDLGRFGEGGGYATSVNDLGQVTGASSETRDKGRAFVWDCANGIQNIGALAEDHYASEGLAINTRGQVIGQSSGMNDSGAFIWDHRNGMRRIENISYAYDLNDRGDVLAYASGGTGLWNERRGLISLDELLGFEYTSDLQINNFRIIGGIRPATEASPAEFFTWHAARGVRLLGADPSTTYTADVTGMNDRGDLIGNVVNDAGRRLPFLLKRNGELEILTGGRPDPDGTAYDINVHRQVVGYISEGSENRTHFIWNARSGLQDLNVLTFGHPLDLTRPYVRTAAGLNNWGWIAATIFDPAISSGHAALLVPVPVDDKRFKNLSKLTGGRLCRALTAVKASALLSCLHSRP
jgi:probable HAF family extracellular repeat protein